MKKRIIALFITAFMLGTLAACAVREGDENERSRRGEDDGGIVQTSANSSGVALAESYDEIFALILDYHARMDLMYGNQTSRSTDAAGGEMAFVTEAEASEPTADTAPPPAMAYAEDSDSMYNDAPMGGGDGYGAMGGGGTDDSLSFSDTNNQVDGVQESDIVKTDGKNIYITSWADSSVNVIAVDNGSMELVAKIKNDNENASLSEMLLYDGKLIIIWNNWEQIELEPIENESDTAQDRMYDSWYWGWSNWHWNYETIVEVYDTSGNFGSPLSTYSQDGWYNSSRMIGSNIYIISSYSPPMMTGFARTELEYYIPTYTVNDETDFIPAGAIALPERLDQIEYTIIGGLCVNSSDLSVSVSANMGSTHLIYASMNNIYLTRTDYGDNWSWMDSHTIINKFAINAGNVNFVASGRVKGNVGSQFYMDEHKGIFRVVTEVWGETEANEDNWWWGWEPHGASLYTMDANMNILDEVHGIGFGENVQSVRFDGDIGYIVTFFIVDPLFSFDLSDPLNIVQLDELKIPGFSRYMHRWADGLLLGVGVEADEEDGMRTGLKVSMFDTSDNENLFERHVHIITRDSLQNNNQDWWSDDWAWAWMSSPAEWEHKSILICTEKNIIGFPYNYSFSSRNHWSSESFYVMFSYDADDGFTLIGEIKYEDETEGWWGNGFQRGLYIGDYMYITSEDRIISLRLGTADIVQELRFFDFAAWYAELQAQWAQWEEEWGNYEWDDWYDDEYIYDWDDEIWIWDEELGDWVIDDSGYAAPIPVVTLPAVIEPRG
jgi:uncharacterized secreted protein with C-terminal beta-propeller domain